MAKAFDLAEKGLGYTSPNPAVGAILFKGGRILAGGYHRRAGLPHAEIEVIRKAGKNARGAILVTTLEPCSHHGKTPLYARRCKNDHIQTFAADSMELQE